jgi:hypothetical protein
MKKQLLIVSIAFFLSGCGKTTHEPDRILTDTDWDLPQRATVSQWHNWDQPGGALQGEVSVVSGPTINVTVTVDGEKVLEKEDVRRIGLEGVSIPAGTLKVTVTRASRSSEEPLTVHEKIIIRRTN